MDYKEKIRSFLNTYGEILFVFLVFFFLVCRNPYSNRTIIANLEPYPDSFHYVNPALSFIQGKGLYITRGESKILPSVPPLYSLSLIPGYLINSDVRTFYFTNVFLGFLSVSLFLLILKEVFPTKRGLRFFLLFLFATNTILYWFPELAMAENLLMPLLLIEVLLLIKPTTRRTATLVPVVAALIYACKFASLSISVSAPILFFFKVLLEKKSVKVEPILKRFAISVVISAAVYLVFDYVFRGSNLVWGLIQMVFDIFSPKKISEAIAGTEETHDFFSVQYLVKNVGIYLSWLVGQKIGVLQKSLAILPAFLAIPGLLGLFLSLRSAKRFVATVWLVFIFFTISLMMLFYAADGRYLIVAVPGLIVGLGFFLEWLERVLKERGEILYALLLAVFFVLYCVTQAPRLKFDVMLNLKYSETPWYYLSVKTFDQYLTEHRAEHKKTPVIISAVPPYFIDLYAKEEFIILPLSAIQEFGTHKQAAWGDHNYDDLPAVYRKYLDEGHPVYLTKYGLGSVFYLHDAYDLVFKKFTVQKVQDGCLSVCDVYRLF